MSLVAGSRLGPYEVTALLGEGGMGQVYRATDSNLKRQVAIKVLPASVADDADRLARFQREAEVLAALNHPNIAAIYGLEKTSDVTALVMELVEGEDLSERLARGAIPLDEALPIARQIAEALEAAHEQGIIHRDLKPANIRVRPDGTVKVLDFGLAKALDQGSGIGDQGSGGLADSPTFTSPAMTMQGVILGTAAYMAPEQAKGKTVDKRADIWAFGSVLFEMLTGRRAFQGEDVSDLLVAVLSKDVDLSTLPAATPRSVAMLIRRCLVRDPKNRLRDIGEARLVLETPETAALTTAGAPPIRSGRPSLWWLAATLIIAATTGAIVWYLRAPKPRAEERLAILSPTVSPPQSVVISPDARTSAILADDKVWLRKLSDFTATEVPGTEGARSVFWSPDSANVGFQARGQLWRVAAHGGSPIAMGAVPTDFTPSGGAAWAPDGRIVFSTGTSTLMQMPTDGSAPASAVFALDPQNDVDVHEPSLLPDGKSALFVIHPAAGIPYSVYVFADGARRAVFTAPNGRVARPRYSPTGHLLFEMNGGVWAAPFSLETKATTGDPVLVADSARQPSVADDGTIVMLSGTAGTALVLTEVDANGKAGAVIGQRRAVSPRLSPDGRFVAAVVGFGALTDIWIFDRTRNTERRLTFEATPDVFPTWSPDGKFIVYMCGTAICARPADGGGTRVELVTRADFGAVTPDGRGLVFRRREGIDSGFYYAELGAAGLSAAVGPPRLIMAQPTLAIFEVSPDGRFVAYTSRETGADSVFVTRFPAAEGKWEVPVRFATYPRWSANGDRLFVFDELSRLVEVPVDLSTSFAAGVPAVRISGLGVQIESGYDRTPDGKSFIVPLPPSATASQVQILLIRNWVPR